MAENPWTPREPSKKRVITVSVTAEQDASFERMKVHFRIAADGTLIKLALEDLWHRMKLEQSNG